MKRVSRNMLWILPYSIISFVPLSYFFLDGLMEVILVNGFKDAFGMDLRELILLIKSILYGVGVGSLSVFLGTGMGLALMCLKQPYKRMVIGVLLVFIPLPMSIHSLMWMGGLSALNQWTHATFSLTGWSISVMVQAFALAPLGTLLIYDAMSKIPQNLIDVGRVQSSDFKVFFRIWLPQCKTGMVTAGIVIFLLSFNDYSVPSSFAVSTFSMEIFANYSVSLASMDALMASLPMVLAVFVLVIPLAKNINQQFFHYTGRPDHRFIKGIQLINLVISKLILGIFGFMILALFMLLLKQTDFAHFNFMKDGGLDLLSTLFITTVAMVLSLPVMTLTALGFHHLKGWTMVKYVLILLPALVPAPLVGASLINFWNTPLFRPVYMSTIMASLAIMIRFMPIGVLVIMAGLNQITQDRISVASLITNVKKDVYLKVMFPLLLPSLLLAAGFVFLMGIGELGASVMVLPPGISTVTVRIFSYLHYGASELIAELSLLVIGAIVVIELILYKGSSVVLKPFGRRPYDRS